MSGFWNTKLAAARAGAALALVALLSACGGGGGDAGTPVVGPETGAGVAVAALAVATNVATLPNDGTATATITVTALDAKNAAIKGATVSLSIAPDSSGVPGTISPGSGVTDEKGELKATLGIGDNKTKRTITITAAAGGVSKTATVSVVDSTTAAPTASNLTLLLDKFTVNNTGSDSVTATVTATGDGGRVVAGIPVTLEVDGGATYEAVPAGATVTNASGVWTGLIKIGSNKIDRVINVNVSSGTLKRSDSFQVTGTRLNVTSFTPTVAAGAAGSITYLVSDVNNAPIKDIDVSVSATGGISSSSGKTNANGIYTFNYTAPSSSGVVTVSAAVAASGGRVTNSQTIVVGSATIPPVTTPVLTVPAPVTATPKVLKVNTASTNEISQIKVLFLGANSTPIPNMRVRFDFNGNPSPNGSISSGDALVYSDAQGNAVTNYRAGTAASATDGVVIRACWAPNDFATGTCPNSSIVTLTVVAEGLAVTIGTDATIAEGASTLTYVKRFVIQVADAAGNPVGSQPITPLVDLVRYYKGDYAWSGTTWLPGRGGWGDGTKSFRQLGILGCANEDGNRNGALESINGASEDVNGNGALDPRKSDVTVQIEGTGKTDASGQAVLRIEYPKSHAGWIGIDITAAADVKSRPAIWSGILPVEAAAVKRETPPPAFATSPYKAGDSGSCAVND